MLTSVTRPAYYSPHTLHSMFLPAIMHGVPSVCLRSLSCHFLILCYRLL